MSNALPLYEGPGGLPGMSTPLESFENQLWFGDITRVLEQTVRIDGASRDVGHTGQTTFLRPGLLMGQVTATKKLKQWNPTATDGTAQISHVLTSFLGAQRAGVDSDLYYRAMRFGDLRTTGLIVPGSANPGIAGNQYEYLIADQLLQAGFRLDNPFYKLGVESYLVAAANVSYTAAQIHGHTIVNLGAAGAVTATLPAALPGVRFRAIAVVNQDLTIAAGSAGLATGNANAVLADLGDSVDIVGVLTAVGSPNTYKWAVVAQNGVAFT